MHTLPPDILPFCFSSHALQKTFLRGYLVLHSLHPVLLMLLTLLLKQTSSIMPKCCPVSLNARMLQCASWRKNCVVDHLSSGLSYTTIDCEHNRSGVIKQKAHINKIMNWSVDENVNKASQKLTKCLPWEQCTVFANALFQATFQETATANNEKAMYISNQLSYNTQSKGAVILGEKNHSTLIFLKFTSSTCPFLFNINLYFRGRHLAQKLRCNLRLLHPTSECLGLCHSPTPQFQVSTDVRPRRQW